jgi:TonB family protein
MNNWMGVTVVIGAIGFSAGCHAAQIPPVPDNPLRAQTLLGFSLRSRCPDLRMVDGGTRTVVVFWVPKRGIHSQVSLKTSSGSNELDAAAISCVAKLRFAPLTTPGDGEPADSWQQIALSWVDQPPVAAPAQIPVSAKQDDSGGPGNSVAVHVCADERGALRQEPAIIESSGVATLDQAAVKIAAAGAAYYHPLTPSSKASTSGCVRLTIKFDSK